MLACPYVCGRESVGAFNRLAGCKCAYQQGDFALLFVFVCIRGRASWMEACLKMPSCASYMYSVD